MSHPPPNAAITSNLLSTHRALLDTLTSFLTVCTHHILYLRRIYPPVSFVSVRAYNYPIRQNRHPEVCTWINDAVTAVRDQMGKERNTVESISLCIFECDRNRVLEKWTFDLSSFPSVSKRDRDVPFATPAASSGTAPASASAGADADSGEPSLDKKINVTDLEANFRATLSRISAAAAKLRPLPEGDDAPECSFTMTIEVKDTADRPVGRLDKHEQQWIAAEPDQFTGKDRRGGGAGGEAGGSAGENGKTHAVRRLEAGEIRMEVWVEESAEKFSFPSSQVTASERNASMSYGAGTEKFDPLNGYELEEPDVNRKPGGGIGTDYQRQ